MLHRIYCQFFAVIVSVGAVHAGGLQNSTPATSPPGEGSRNAAHMATPEAADQQLRQDVQSMLSRAAASGALGPHPGQATIKLDEPARRVTNLGTLVDSTNAASARDGLRVLGATPGSTAEHLGLRPGDIIVAVNGISLRGLGADADGRALAATTLKSTVESLPDNAMLDLQVVRDGNALALNAPLQTVQLPALHMELGAAVLTATAATAADSTASTSGMGTVNGTCGRISMFDVAPRGDHLYAARILLLDGSSPGPTGQSSFRVSAGTHQLLVAENIPTRALGMGEIATLRRQTSKPLTVNVRAGMTSMISAQLHLSKTSDLSGGTYWDPVVWREIPEKCP